MKKIRFFIYAAVLGIVASCTMATTPREPSQQEVVMNYLRFIKNEEYRQSNEIQKKEFVDKFEQDFYQMLDSIKLLTNWKGVIRNINQRETANTIDLTFDIECPIEDKYGKLSFSCQHLLDKANKDTDRIYQQVYAMYNGSPVVFDGFARTKNNEIYWTGSRDLRTSYPDLGFWVSDIVKGSVKDTISADLRKACMLAFESVNLIRQEDEKKISKSEFDKRAAELKKENEAVGALLNEKEKDYLNTVTTDAFYNYNY